MKVTDAERAAELVIRAREQFAGFTSLDNMHNLLRQWMGKNSDESVSGRLLERLLDLQDAHQHLRDALEAACEDAEALLQHRKLSDEA